MITCIKSINTKKGLIFTKGNDYEVTFSQEGARVYTDKFNFVTIKSEEQFKKYFN